jgi:hypothetical protein
MVVLIAASRRIGGFLPVWGEKVEGCGAYGAIGGADRS